MWKDFEVGERIEPGMMVEFKCTSLHFAPSLDGEGQECTGIGRVGDVILRDSPRGPVIFLGQLYGVSCPNDPAAEREVLDGTDHSFGISAVTKIWHGATA